MMRHLTLVTLALTLAIAVPLPASADYLDGNKLLQFCSTERDQSGYWQDDATCTAYVMGGMDALSLWRAVNKARSCMPENVTAGQARDIVVKYLRDNPAVRNEGAGILVALAMKGAYGCTVDPAK